MAIPVDSLPKIDITKVGQTTLLRYQIINSGIDITYASNKKRSLEIHNIGIKILPENDEPILGNFYLDPGFVQTPNSIDAEDLLQKLSENEMFQ